ncbi:reductive dehalogenase [Chloroflexota bacterium]
MKKLTPSAWEKEYIVGPVERFDRKNTGPSRLIWDDSMDPSIKKLLKDIPADGAINPDHPGLTVMERAMRTVSRSTIRMIDLFNVSKPNLNPASKAIMDAMSNAGVLPPKPTEGAKIDIGDPQKITRAIKKVATHFGADLVGICKLDRRWVYSHTYNDVPKAATSESTELDMSRHKRQEIPDEFQYAIVMAVGGDYDMRRYFPTYISAADLSNSGVRGILANIRLTAFIQNLGFKVIDCTWDDVGLAIPMAMQAGLGQIGRNGLLITPQFGPTVRIGQVLTDLPLIPDAPIDFGVTEFCRACKKCADMCPSNSIPHGERTAEPTSISNASGELKWQCNPISCRDRFAHTKHPCQICISCCPFNKPDTWFHRTVRWFVDKARWSDSFYVKMDNLFGYGKPKKADNFWEEWQPGKGRKIS